MLPPATSDVGSPRTLRISVDGEIAAVDDDATCSRTRLCATARNPQGGCERADLSGRMERNGSTMEGARLSDHERDAWAARRLARPRQDDRRLTPVLLRRVTTRLALLRENRPVATSRTALAV